MGFKTKQNYNKNLFLQHMNNFNNSNNSIANANTLPLFAPIFHRTCAIGFPNSEQINNKFKHNALIKKLNQEFNKKYIKYLKKLDEYLLINEIFVKKSIPLDIVFYLKQFI